MQTYNISIILAWLFLLFACNPDNNKQINSNHKASGGNLQYAQGFDYNFDGDTCHVKVKSPWQGAANISLKYCIANKKPYNIASDVQFIKTPISKIICMSTTHIAQLDFIGQEEKIVGISGGRYIYHPEIRLKIDEQKIVDVGMPQALNYEKILQSNADLLIIYGVGGETQNLLSKLKELGIQTVISADYLEPHPLGKAEWIKFMALFTRSLRTANQQFEQLVNNYNRLKNKAAETNNRPTILLNVPYQGVWYMPGGQSYMAQLIADAGGHYLFAHIAGNESAALPIETIYMKGIEADIWINPGTSTTKKSLAQSDVRLKDFSAFTRGAIFGPNKQTTTQGGNNYWELASVRPDLLLHDLHVIIKEDSTAYSNMHFYKKLE